MIEIEKTISEWAKNTFSGSSCSYEATIAELPSAPPFLFTGSTGSGFCVTIKPAASFCAESKIHHSKSNIQGPSLGFWIPSSGAPGSQVALREGDDEIGVSSVQWMEFRGHHPLSNEDFHLTGEEALVVNFTDRFHDFRQNHVFAPALEDWIETKGLSYSLYRPDIIGAEAMEIGIEDWLLVSIELENQDTPPIIIGVSGRGQAATLFYSDTEVEGGGAVEYIEIEQQTDGLQSPADLQDWLEATVSPLLATESVATP
jgi:hypothetical protein